MKLPMNGGKEEITSLYEFITTSPAPFIASVAITLHVK